MWKQLPEKFLEQYKDLSPEELLEKLHDTEEAIVSLKKENKGSSKEFSEKEKEYNSRIEKLEADFSQRKKDDFLRDKKFTDDERKVFDEKLSKGYDLEDAYNIATHESQIAARNADKVNQWNDFTWKWISWDLKSISNEEYQKIAQEVGNSPEALNLFQEIDGKINSGEMKVV